MPLCADPNLTAEFYLPGYAHIPPSRRPVFLVKFLTKTELEKHGALVERALAADVSNEESLRCALEALDLGVVGWRNVTDAAGNPVGYHHGALGMLSVNEFWDLVVGYPRAVRLLEDDLKNLAGPSPLPSANSAGTATTAAAM